MQRRIVVLLGRRSSSHSGGDVTRVWGKKDDDKLQVYHTYLYLCWRRPDAKHRLQQEPPETIPSYLYNHKQNSHLSIHI